MRISTPPVDQVVPVDNLLLSLLNPVLETTNTLRDETLSPFNEFIVGLHTPDICIDTHLPLIMEHKDDDPKPRQSLDYNNNNLLEGNPPSRVSYKSHKNLSLDNDSDLEPAWVNGERDEYYDPPPEGNDYVQQVNIEPSWVNGDVDQYYDLPPVVENSMQSSKLEPTWVNGDVGDFYNPDNILPFTGDPDIEDFFESSQNDDLLARPSLHLTNDLREVQIDCAIPPTWAYDLIPSARGSPQSNLPSPVTIHPLPEPWISQSLTPPEAFSPPKFDNLRDFPEVPPPFDPWIEHQPGLFQRREDVHVVQLTPEPMTPESRSPTPRPWIPPSREKSPYLFKEYAPSLDDTTPDFSLLTPFGDGNKHPTLSQPDRNTPSPIGSFGIHTPILEFTPIPEIGDSIMPRPPTTDLGLTRMIEIEGSQEPDDLQALTEARLDQVMKIAVTEDPYPTNWDKDQPPPPIRVDADKVQCRVDAVMDGVPWRPPQPHTLRFISINVQKSSENTRLILEKYRDWDIILI